MPQSIAARGREDPDSKTKARKRSRLTYSGCSCPKRNEDSSGPSSGHCLVFGNPAESEMDASTLNPRFHGEPSWWPEETAWGGRHFSHGLTSPDLALAMSDQPSSRIVRR